MADGRSPSFSSLSAAELGGRSSSNTLVPSPRGSRTVSSSVVISSPTQLASLYKGRSIKPDKLTIEETLPKGKWSGHQGCVTSIFPSKEQVLSTSSDGAFNTWKFDGTSTREWKGDSKKMIVRDNYLICCSHGNFGTEPGVVKVYDLLRQDWVLLYKGHELYITDIAINPIGSMCWIATSSADNTVREWTFSPSSPELMMAGDWFSMQVQTPRHTCKGHKDIVNCVMYMQNTLFSGGADKVVIAWHAGQPVQVYKGHTGAVTCLVQCPASNSFFSASADETIRQWDVKSGSCLTGLNTKSIMVAMTMHRDFLYAWSAGPKFAITAFDLKSANLYKYDAHTAKVNVVKFTEECMFTGSQDATVIQWDVVGHRCLRIFRGPAGKEGVTTLCPSGGTLYIGVEKLISLWDCYSDAEVRDGRAKRRADTQAMELQAGGTRGREDSVVDQYQMASPRGSVLLSEEDLAGSSSSMSPIKSSLQVSTPPIRPASGSRPDLLATSSSSIIGSSTSSGSASGASTPLRASTPVQPIASSGSSSSLLGGSASSANSSPSVARNNTLTRAPLALGQARSFTPATPSGLNNSPAPGGLTVSTPNISTPSPVVSNPFMAAVIAPSASEPFAPVPRLQINASPAPVAPAPAASTATSTVSPRPDWNDDTPAAVVMKAVAADMNMEAGALTTILNSLASEYIVNVGDLKMLGNDSYKDLKIPIGVANRIRAKIKDVPSK